MAAVEAKNSPVHLLIGSDAIDQLRTKLDAMRAETMHESRRTAAPI